MKADIEIRKGVKDCPAKGIYHLVGAQGSDPYMNEQVVAIILGLAEPVEMP